METVYTNKLACKPDGWKFAETLTSSDWENAKFRIITGNQVVKSLAVNITRTGAIKPTSQENWFQARGKIEFVGDGTPSVYDGCLIYGTFEYLNTIPLHSIR